MRKSSYFLGGFVFGFGKGGGGGREVIGGSCDVYLFFGLGVLDFWGVG